MESWIVVLFWTNGKNCRKSFRRFRCGNMSRKLHFQQMMVDEISHKNSFFFSKFTIFSHDMATTKVRPKSLTFQQLLREITRQISVTHQRMFRNV